MSQSLAFFYKVRHSGSMCVTIGDSLNLKLSLSYRWCGRRYRCNFMANGQTYFMITKELLAFINAPTFKHKNPADISRAADIKSARAAKSAISGEVVSMKTAKKIWEVCVVEGYKGTFSSAFSTFQNN
jgi:hypothetical protein